MKIAQLFDLSGRRALVTGGNSGIGEAMARALGLAGAQVLLMARRQPELDLAAARLSAEGIAVTALAANLANPTEARQAALAAQDLLGGVDILVNAAGINMRQPFMEVTPESWTSQLALHLAAPFFLTQALAPAMKARNVAPAKPSLRV